MSGDECSAGNRNRAELKAQHPVDSQGNVPGRGTGSRGRRSYSAAIAGREPHPTGETRSNGLRAHNFPLAQVQGPETLGMMTHHSTAASVRADTQRGPFAHLRSTIY